MIDARRGRGRSGIVLPMSDQYLAELNTARVVIDIPVAWGEMDALGHVNNVAYYRYLESARVAYLRRVGFERLGPRDRAGFILQSASCRFRRPVVFPDTLRVSARCTALLEDRFTLTHVVVSAAQGAAAAVGESVIVGYDYAAGCKAPIDAGLATAIRGLDGV